MSKTDQEDDLIRCMYEKYSPYKVFTAQEWSQFRADTPLTLTFDEIKHLRSLDDPVDLEEVQRIYLSLARLLSCHVEAIQNLFQKRQQFLHQENIKKNPFIIGISGSVAVGKSTTARILQELLKRWAFNLKVDLITTDGFLYPNAVLQKKNRMNRKGFPDSYDIKKLLHFLSAIKAGISKVSAPLYSHITYDVLEDQKVIIDHPDILIVEGVNVLQVNRFPNDKRIVPFVSDFFDFSIYVDAETDMICYWYLERFKRLRKTAFQNPESYFYRYALLSEEEALKIAENIWRTINLKNLQENILPTRSRADLILRKGKNHLVEYVALRKL
ncbi:pantothenate kinase [Bartonella bacilliformis str. Heidi Mejia]|nr:type I pantothenate kinase [Bartonella bacilliformis]EYS88966.1 pantothenate kinase [Bartonella bacilliformis San Pedro600-02]EYS90927.1 pantothenate kinase [Bartonella bacilliformis str. Heidi Mejia]EYS95670.1 pantothenate kinase [Bartonella bacilliformis Peru-18]KEG16003.1 pantothenate kinase [Bartonella bacilliformis CUSCO5]KEG17495.1 pantothenate kinase [Bartonella bacilliformis Hosp800-02]KEG19434.1 pantothenate kinase [Bartonella bacilliformis Peru38]KEG21625.1 pantothenate kinase [